MKHGQAAWFEIPVTNLDRAIKFYNEVLNITVVKEVFKDREFGVFKKEQDGINGVLLVKENHTPGNGIVLFFYVSVLSDVLNSVRENQGIIVTPKTLIRQHKDNGETLISSNLIGENVGYFSEIIDSEGNNIGLYGNS